jgi:drug/metabolite transporter (DMT)-like permease
MNKALLANMAAAAAALSAGASVVATRVVVVESDPVAVAFYRYVIAGACLLPVLLATWPRERLPLAEVGKIALLGALFFAFFPWAFNAGLQHTTAARGAVGLATIPIQTLIVAALAGREAASMVKLASVGLAFAGVVTALGPAALGGGAHLLGDGMMLIGAFSAALYSVFGRPVLARHGPLFVTALAMLFGVLALLPLAAAGGAVIWPTFSREGWLAMIFLGTLGGALQFVLYTWALRWLPPSRVVIYLALNPVTAMLLAAIILDETVTVALVSGLALVLGGIAVANWPRPAPARA